jgi:hypothetical protein
MDWREEVGWSNKTIVEAVLNFSNSQRLLIWSRFTTIPWVELQLEPALEPFWSSATGALSSLDIYFGLEARDSFPPFMMLVIIFTRLFTNAWIGDLGIFLKKGLKK